MTSEHERAERAQKESILRKLEEAIAEKIKNRNSRFKADDTWNILVKIEEQDIANFYSDKGREALKKEKKAVHDLLLLDEEVVRKLMDLKAVELALLKNANALGQKVRNAPRSELTVEIDNFCHLLVSIIQNHDLEEDGSKTDVTMIAGPQGVIRLLSMIYHCESREFLEEKDMEKLFSDIPGLVNGKFQMMKKDKSTLARYMDSEEKVLHALNYQITQQIHYLNTLTGFLEQLNKSTGSGSSPETYKQTDAGSAEENFKEAIKKMEQEFKDDISNEMRVLNEIYIALQSSGGLGTVKHAVQELKRKIMPDKGKPKNKRKKSK